MKKVLIQTHKNYDIYWDEETGLLDIKGIDETFPSLQEAKKKIDSKVKEDKIKNQKASKLRSRKQLK